MPGWARTAGLAISRFCLDIASCIGALSHSKGKRMKVSLIGRTISIAVILVASVTASEAAGANRLTFTTHAAFFSSETKQPKPIDPQVFVQDGSAPAATGPQNIPHTAGIRPAFIDQDAKTTPLYTAKNEPLGFDLGHWLNAKGIVTIAPFLRGRARIRAQFTNLQPRGFYSLFENHFDQQPVGFTPLDGTGKSNNFVANKRGTARITLLAPRLLTHANAVLLVYHSDKTFHGDQRGEIGITAHHQLIARIPE